VPNPTPRQQIIVAMLAKGMSPQEVADELGLKSIDSHLSRMRAAGIAIPAAPGNCRVCLGPAPADDDQCARCRAELAEQLERMGGPGRAMPSSPPAALEMAPDPAIPPLPAPALELKPARRPGDILDDLASSPLKDVLLDVFREASSLERPAREEIGKAAVSFARARGWRETRAALITLSAVAVKFAARLDIPRPSTRAKSLTDPSAGALSGQVPVAAPRA
jgi:hypothetical protein